MEPTIKVLLLGDGGVGKTSWVAALKNEDFNQRYIPTYGVNVTEFDFTHKNKSYRFAIWDCAGLPNNYGLRDGYFLGGQAGIIMYDASNHYTKSAASRWKRDLISVCGQIPIVTVQNKTDLIMPELDPQSLVIPVSVRSKSEITKPIKKLCNHFSLTQVQNPNDRDKDH